MSQPNDLSRSLVALDQDSTIIAVVEMSQSSWLVACMLPGIERQPRKKLEPSAERLLGLLHRWRDEAVKDGRKITRIALAFEAGRDGFWLARWLRARGVEAHVIHPSSVAVSREHRPGEDRPARHRVAEAGVLGVAAWGKGPLHHGPHPDDCPELETTFAKQLGVPLLLANVTQQVYQMARAAGLNKEDGSSIIKVFERMAGVTIGDDD
jgi:hypothetical protein